MGTPRRLVYGWARLVGCVCEYRQTAMSSSDVCLVVEAVAVGVGVGGTVSINGLLFQGVGGTVGIDGFKQRVTLCTRQQCTNR